MSLLPLPQGVQKNKFQHGTGLITKIFRAGTRGAGPGGPFDFFIDLLAWVKDDAIQFL